ncbi:MAG: hypothetical protein QOG34_2307 [Frankiaceae bacterium]|nr:hypothetical protein [Frankiaceae bacterium]
MSNRVLAGIAALSLAIVTGCGGVPDGGGVHLGRALPAVGGADDAFDFDVKALPPPWRSGMSPDEVVAGFLRAVVNGDGDYAIARSYLWSGAARSWDPVRSITMYDGLRITSSGIGAVRTVRLRAVRTGAVDERGNFDPTRGSMDETLGLNRLDGQWRIDRLPPGVLLSTLDAQRSIRLARVYYPNRGGTALVPEQTFVRTTRAGFATALIRTLLAGPGRWLAPAVTRPAPSGTTLIGNVPVVAGVADVNLSPSARQATTRQLEQLSAAMVWTLRQVTDITSVRLLIDGSPLSLPKIGTTQPITAWPAFDPAGTVAGPTLFVLDGQIRAVNGSASSIAVRRNVSAVAESATADVVAVVRKVRTGAVLATGPIGGTLVNRMSARAMTPPSVDADGDTFTVVTTPIGQRVKVVLRSGAVRSVTTDPQLSGAEVTALRVSRDGARVAAVVGGRLMIGRVQPGPGGPILTSFRNVLPTAVDVRGVAWVDAGDVVATVRSGRTARALVVADVDGYAGHSVSIDGLGGRAVDVAAAPGRPLLVTTDAETLWSDSGGWHQLGRGGAAAYPA